MLRRLRDGVALTHPVGAISTPPLEPLTLAITPPCGVRPKASRPWTLCSNTLEAERQHLYEVVFTEVSSASSLIPYLTIQVAGYHDGLLQAYAWPHLACSFHRHHHQSVYSLWRQGSTCSTVCCCSVSHRQSSGCALASQIQPTVAAERHSRWHHCRCTFNPTVTCICKDRNHTWPIWFDV